MGSPIIRCSSLSAWYPMPIRRPAMSGNRYTSRHFLPQFWQMHSTGSNGSGWCTRRIVWFSAGLQRTSEPGAGVQRPPALGLSVVLLISFPLGLSGGRGSACRSDYLARARRRRGMHGSFLGWVCRPPRVRTLGIFGTIFSCPSHGHIPICGPNKSLQQTAGSPVCQRFVACW